MLAQGAQRAQGARRVVQQRHLGDLHAHARRIRADRIEHGQQAVGEIRRTEMPRRHVDRDVALPAARKLADHLFVQQPVHLLDQAAVLAQADELGRQQQAAALVLPAQQRLMADDRAILQAA